MLETLQVSSSFSKTAIDTTALSSCTSTWWWFSVFRFPLKNLTRKFFPRPIPCVLTSSKGKVCTHFEDPSLNPNGLHVLTTMYDTHLHGRCWQGRWRWRWCQVVRPYRSRDQHDLLHEMMRCSTEPRPMRLQKQWSPLCWGVPPPTNNTRLQREKSRREIRCLPLARPGCSALLQ